MSSFKMDKFASGSKIVDQFDWKLRLWYIITQQCLKDENTGMACIQKYFFKNQDFQKVKHVILHTRRLLFVYEKKKGKH